MKNFFWMSVIRAEVILYLLFYNFHDCTFNLKDIEGKFFFTEENFCIFCSFCYINFVKMDWLIILKSSVVWGSSVVWVVTTQEHPHFQKFVQEVGILPHTISSVYSYIFIHNFGLFNTIFKTEVLKYLAWGICDLLVWETFQGLHQHKPDT